MVLQPSSPSNDKYGSDGTPIEIQSISGLKALRIRTSVPHGLSDRDYVTIGAPGLVLNRRHNIFRVKREDDDPYSFELEDSMILSGSLSSGATVTLLNPGQNNEGWRKFDVQSATQSPSAMEALTAAPTQDGVVESATPEAKLQPQRAFKDFLTADSVKVVSEDDEAEGIASGADQGTAASVKQHRPLRIRVGAFSDAAHTDSATLLLFEGDPAAGAAAFASATVHPGNHSGRGTYAWFDWTPQTAGTHHMYAKLLGSDREPGSADKVVAFNIDVQ